MKMAGSRMILSWKLEDRIDWVLVNFLEKKEQTFLHFDSRNGEQLHFGSCGWIAYRHSSSEDFIIKHVYKVKAMLRADELG